MNIDSIWILAIICFLVSLFSSLHKGPMNFWTGQKKLKNKTANYKKYNLANSLMWFIIGMYFLIAAYFEYIGDINTVHIMMNIFIKYIIVLMIICYLGIYYFLLKKNNHL